MCKKGFTFLEFLVALAIGAMVIVVGVPTLSEVVRRSRHGSAVRKVLSDVRDARARAIATGWEYRVVGYDSDELGTRRNQYRTLARRSSAVAWPDEEVAPFLSNTQMASRWVDVAASYTGISLDTTGPRFEVTFDSRGTAPGAAADFNPLRVKGSGGLEASLTISVVGGARAE